MSTRRPHPGPDPSPAAWAVVLFALFRTAGELLAQGLRLAAFGCTRSRWRRAVAERVRRDPLPVGAASMSRPRAPALAALLVALVLLAGCAPSRTGGTRSSWELFARDSKSPRARLADTARILEGGNDWADVRLSARLFDGPEHAKGGFDVISRDLRKTFAPPFDFQEWRTTVRLLE